MARTFVRQVSQIKNSDTYSDALAAGATLQSGQTTVEGDLNALRSQIKRHLYQDAVGNWYDDITTVNGKKRAIKDLNTDLNDIEEKKTLTRVSVLTDITVGAGVNYHILVVATSQAPTQVAAVLAATDGAVVAQSALSGAGFAANELTEVAGPDAINPKNLLIIRDATTGQLIQSSGRDVFGLLQYESTGVNGAAFNDVTSGNRAKISFVRLTSGLDDLEACPTADIAGKSINYAYVRRIRFDDLPEDSWLTSASFVDQATSVDITRQTAYNNQGATPVELATNATLDLNGAGRYWEIRDLANATLFRATDGSAGGTTQVLFAADVDTLLSNAIVNQFDKGLRVATGTTRINVGETAGTIETTLTADLRVLGAGELYLDDGNQVGSTWAQTNGIKLSDTTQEWSDFETAFGETSLLRAIYLAANVNQRGTKTYANVTANVTANADVGGVSGGTNLDAQLPNMSTGTFTTAYDVYLNGVLLRSGADASANNDYYPGTSLANGQLKFEFDLKIGDVLCVVPFSTTFPT